VLWRSQQFPSLADFHNATRVHYCNPITDLANDTKIVTYQDQSHAKIAIELAE
jgi:hypothetical protein